METAQDWIASAFKPSRKKNVFRGEAAVFKCRGGKGVIVIIGSDDVILRSFIKTPAEFYGYGARWNSVQFGMPEVPPQKLIPHGFKPDRDVPKKETLFKSRRKFGA